MCLGHIKCDGLRVYQPLKTRQWRNQDIQLKQALPQPWSGSPERASSLIVNHPEAGEAKLIAGGHFLKLWSLNPFSIRRSIELRRKNMVWIADFVNKIFEFFTFSQFFLIFESRQCGFWSRHCWLLPQPGYVIETRNVRKLKSCSDN